jgi:hypothetical protein
MNKGIENLLRQTASINKQYKKIAEITGENYNVFRVLNLQTREVRMHSAFIAELLNPKGNHGQGNVFIIEFIEMLKRNSKCLPKENNTEVLEIKFDATKAKSAKVESWLGKTTDKEGGFIDILLTDASQKHIIIENKIYAGDQRKQLLRYHNFDKDAPIIYLTLDGKKPSDYSISNGMDGSEIEADIIEILKAEGADKKAELDKLINQIVCISYKFEILKWLEECKKYTVDHPLLRETITQYIHLIKYLTNQTINNDMENEILNEVLKNEESFNAFKELFNSKNNLLHYYIKEKLIPFLKEIKVKIKEGKNGSHETANILNEINISDVSFELHLDEKILKNEIDGEKYFSYSNEKLRDLNLAVTFGFSNSKRNYQYFIYGFRYIDPTLGKSNFPNLKIKCETTFQVQFSSSPESKWLCWRQFDEYDSDWNNLEILQKIQFGKFNEELVEKLVAMLKITDDDEVFKF